jgi:hypothetical protein
LAWGIVSTVAYAGYGGAINVYAAQTGNSFFENSSPTLTWTGSSSLPTGSDRCVSNLQGYVIPNNTTKNFANSPGHECDGTGAVGDVRMKQVTGDPNVLNDRRNGFYQILYHNYHYGDAWEKAGASQVALSLLGYGFGSGGGTGSAHGRDISAAEWTDLRNRITAPDIEIMWTSRNCPAGSTWCIPGGAPFQYNTAGVIANGRYDAIKIDNGAGFLNVDAWVFRSKNNPSSVYGVYEIECGNGIGNVAGLPAYTPTYDLTPSVTNVSPEPVEAGSRVTISSQINYSGNTVSRSTQWQINQIVTRPGATQPVNKGGGTSASGNIPCGFYGKSSADCSGFGANGSGVYASDTTLPIQNSPSLDYPVGTEICYGLSVQPRAYSSDEWVHSALRCTMIAVKPKMQVWGSDLRTRGKIETGTTFIDSSGTGRLFGSWVEYGGFSVGTNDGFASGAGTNNGTTSATTASVWHQLTFANIDNSGASSFGQYALGALPALTNQFIGGPSGGTFNGNLGSLNSGTYAVGDVTISDSSVGQAAGIGKSIIIVSSGTVTINGDIAYTGTSGDTFTALSQIPQVVIIANTINITNSAGRIDAWLLTRGAGGRINTCSDRALSAPLNSTVCNNPLTVNGPVATSHLYLRRTAGAGSVATAGMPAEVFNLRPDAYVWAYARASQASKAQTVDSVELPPRF